MPQIFEELAISSSGEWSLEAANHSIELYTKLITISQVIPLVSLKSSSWQKDTWTKFVGD